MLDDRPNSFVICHAHGAQILESSRQAFSNRLCNAIWSVDEKAREIFILWKLFIAG
jgi:hypothetical protein